MSAPKWDLWSCNIGDVILMESSDTLSSSRSTSDCRQLFVMFLTKLGWRNNRCAVTTLSLSTEYKILLYIYIEVAIWPLFCNNHSGNNSSVSRCLKHLQFDSRSEQIFVFVHIFFPVWMFVLVRLNFLKYKQNQLLTFMNYWK